jgi:predicted phage terminase large subunit-like protein
MTRKPQPLPASSLPDYLRQPASQTPLGFAYVASGGRYQSSDHLQLLDDKLWQLATGRIKRLMVWMPPRHGKSLLCSQYFPAWYVGAFRKRYILASYEATFAATWGRLARDVLTEYGPLVFDPPARVSQSSSAADHWELEGAAGQYGVMQTAGVGGALTGKGAAILSIDDPVKNAEEAASPVMREKAWQWWTSTAYTRLEPDGGVLIIQTRWHELDLSGRILEENGGTRGWEVLSLPAIAEQDERIEMSEGDVYTRGEGEPLWPGRFGHGELARIREDVGTRVWASLYQQRPAPASGSVWHLEWWRRYPELPALETVTLSVDSAFETGVANDYSVIAAWGANATGHYLLDVWRKRVAYPQLKAGIIDMAAKHRPNAVLIEKKASGHSAIQELSADTTLPIIGIEPKGSKVSRAEAASPTAEAGNCYIPVQAEWLKDWLDEHTGFPHAAHDDCPDTTSQYLNWYRTRPRVRARLLGGSRLCEVCELRPVAGTCDVCERRVCGWCSYVPSPGVTRCQGHHTATQEAQESPSEPPPAPVTPRARTFGRS